MNKFITKAASLGITSVLIFVTVIWAIVTFCGGKLDPFFLRLRTEHNGGLVIGTSRAAQSLEPQYIDDVDYNFAFTIFHSPFDNDYYQLIKKFHKSKNTTYKHVVCVDPWSLFSYAGDKYENTNPGFAGNIHSSVILFSWLYLIKYVKLKGFDFLYARDYVSQSGRYVVDIGDSEYREEKDRRLKAKIESYQKKETFVKGIYSKTREKNLMNIIKFLNKSGSVCLIRLPVSEEMFQLENRMCPEFSNLMKDISTKMDVDYFDLTNRNREFRYTDGNHIWNKESSKISTLVDSCLKVGR